MTKKAAAAVTVLFVLGFAGVASAEETDDYKTQDEKDGYSVTFKDDGLLGGGLDGGGPMIKVRGRPVRVTLIRPRTSFVQEMLKSVENL